MYYEVMTYDLFPVIMQFEIIKGKFKQQHQYQQKLTITSHLNSLNTNKNHDNDVGNPGTDFGQAQQKMAGLDRSMGS